ncbi:peptidoglycan DD-metalloendopeptidase family protein [Azotobacter vinelandii]|uniref:peptidoglycan DD-metalloendopeptidase family protein n=1 Tax=Azotobacter vinelandii TaxID=354 RepID=UPI0026654E97|nr:peptidoglycan DD-metalloendopeptidase family protein [Azotobacter vinelandii]WKN21747.1 M23 family metallopeptidase [Azotobacter vinelandii]
MLGRPLLFAVFLVLAAPATAVTIYEHVDANGVVSYGDKARPGARVIHVIQPGRGLRGLRAIPAGRLPGPGPVSSRSDAPDDRVRLDTFKHAGGHTLRVQNDMFAPVEVELSLDGLANVSGAPNRPIRWIVPPRSQIRLATLAPRDPDQPMRYTPKLRHALGDPRLRPQPHRYPLPWRGGPFRLTQGANGQYSHYTPKGRHAVDIAMPVGTPIVAARSGVVVHTENDQRGRSPNPGGNQVRILHEDGTMGVYLHLQEGSVRVSEGQRIKAGTPIARSGNTGRSTGPHLHFVVQRNVGLAVESIPFQFSQPVNALPNFAVGGD